MCQEADVLFGLLACAQVAHGDCVMRPATEIDRTQNELDWDGGTVSMQHISFQRVVGTLDEIRPNNWIWNHLLKRGADQAVRRRTKKPRQTVVHRDDPIRIADQKSFDGRVGETAHALGLELAAAAVAHLDCGAGERQRDDDQRRQRHRDGQQACREGRARDCDRRIRQKRSGAHGGEMVAADRKRHEQSAKEPPIHAALMQPNRQRGAAEYGT